MAGKPGGFGHRLADGACEVEALDAFRVNGAATAPKPAAVR